VPDLVIFDNDGVLVDSEPITHGVLVDMVRAVGVSMDVQEALSLFKGGKMTDCVAELEQRRGAPMAGDFVQEFRERCDVIYRRDLQAMPGVAGMLDAIEAAAMPYCVASNGPADKVRTTLGAVGLLPRFQDRIFSAYTRQRFKPDPDVFLQAADSLGVDPARCVVIEDSVHGVEAATAAGMRVLGFGTDDVTAPLREQGATTFDSFEKLPTLLSELAV